MFKLRILVLSVVASLVIVDSVSAGLLGLGQRRWERRKAELHAELAHSLSHKIDQDLAREVAAATEQLANAAREQVALEAGRLEAQVRESLTQLRAEASQLVSAEATRLEQLVASELEQLKEQSRDLVSQEAIKLKELTDQEIEKLNVRYAEQAQAMRTTLDEEIAKLPGVISAQVERSMATVGVKAVSGNDEQSEEPSTPVDGTDVPSTPPAADLTRETRLRDADN